MNRKLILEVGSVRFKVQQMRNLISAHTLLSIQEDMEHLLIYPMDKILTL